MNNLPGLTRLLCYGVDPAQCEAANNLASLLARSAGPRLYEPAVAVAIAQHACGAQKQASAAYDETLATAYLAAGRTTDAAQAFGRAIAAQAEGWFAEAAHWRARLAECALPGENGGSGPAANGPHPIWTTLRTTLA